MCSHSKWANEQTQKKECRDLIIISFKLTTYILLKAQNTQNSTYNKFMPNALRKGILPGNSKSLWHAVKIARNVGESKH